MPILILLIDLGRLMQRCDLSADSALVEMYLAERWGAGTARCRALLAAFRGGCTLLLLGNVLTLALLTILARIHPN